jgi:Domain of unknown function (DUF397)
VPAGAARAGRDSHLAAITGKDAMTGKPTVEDLGIDITAQRWHRSGDGAGAIEVAMLSPEAAPGGGPAGAGWVLMRVAGDPAGRVLVYDRNEWECFLDGVRNGEFDDALADGAQASDVPSQGAGRTYP